MSDEREREAEKTLVPPGASILSVLSGTLSACLTLCRVHRLPGGSEACVHHLVI